MSDIIKAAWKKYMLELEFHPLRTKAITAGVFIGFGDIVYQKFSGIKKFQLRRLLLLMLYGFAYWGPFRHLYEKLEHVIFKGKKDGKTVAKKVLLEQLISSPWSIWCYMMYFELVVEGRAWVSAKNRIRKEFLSAQLTQWKVRAILYGSIASFRALLNLKARLEDTKKAQHGRRSPFL